jgi:hypothetical protein
LHITTDDDDIKRLDLQESQCYTSKSDRKQQSSREKKMSKNVKARAKSAYKKVNFSIFSGFLTTLIFLELFYIGYYFTFIYSFRILFKRTYLVNHIIHLWIQEK